MEKKNDEQGSVTLEAAIILPIFCALFMALNGFFFTFNAQNQISHALIQSASSLGLDPYLNEKIDSGLDGAHGFWGGLSDALLDGVRRLATDGYFTSPNDWYSSGGGAENTIIGSEDAKKRFVAYLTGDTSESKADEKLKHFGIEGGLSGMHFTATNEGGDVVLKVNYRMGVWFDMFGKKKMEVTQSARAKLWGVDGK
jgi:hypothetical protein